jgi:outer membrane murein-binding lipoprotein Lpp
MPPSERRLLDSLASQVSVLADDIAALEQREEDIRVQLDTARALRSELVGTADVLNRQRLC